LVLIIVKNRL